MSLHVRPLTAGAIEPYLRDLGRLRIRVFRDWPYLYEGSEDYEQQYLRAFAAARDAVLVAAFDGETVVGAATASPMAAQDADVKQVFVDRRGDLSTIFYFGESVLLPEYRGRGIGHAFFDAREGQARACGATIATFCGVVRPEDHVLRPAGYRPLDAFWRKRGYAPMPGLVTSYRWRDIGEQQETDHPMQFWLRAL
ncbi:GNAT family N-acetyltransferase [Sphingomonas sp.]|uniref:GNAT family N-acetyltransferase n=1 Tax=Sphingomonas sp. TaxID=28214 RepID=UPI001B0F93BC|nr:GNAT family N-acetyltransferase [Sphingomonas sp.]MBO9714945.1 GNAT family N-acetyltransferase [Sphingomonas sp.]